MRRFITLIGMGMLVIGGIISAQQPAPRITRIEFTPAKVDEGSLSLIHI